MHVKLSLMKSTCPTCHSLGVPYLSCAGQLTKLTGAAQGSYAILTQALGAANDAMPKDALSKMLAKHACMCGIIAITFCE